MKKTIIMFAVLTVLAGFALPSYASDWDTAGKILTGIEGVRILTGGKVDVIGSITGINSGNRGYDNYYDASGYGARVTTRVWVPQTVWEERWVPAHKEFRHGMGWVLVPGHYERYKVDSGYWTTAQHRPYQRTSFRTYHR